MADAVRGTVLKSVYDGEIAELKASIEIHERTIARLREKNIEEETSKHKLAAMEARAVAAEARLSQVQAAEARKKDGSVAQIEEESCKSKLKGMEDRMVALGREHEDAMVAAERKIGGGDEEELKKQVTAAVVKYGECEKKADSLKDQVTAAVVKYGECEKSKDALATTPSGCSCDGEGELKTQVVAAVVKVGECLAEKDTLVSDMAKCGCEASTTGVVPPSRPTNTEEPSEASLKKQVLASVAKFGECMEERDQLQAALEGCAQCSGVGLLKESKSMESPQASHRNSLWRKLAQWARSTSVTDSLSASLGEEVALGEDEAKASLPDQVIAAVAQVGKCIKQNDALKATMIGCSCEVPPAALPNVDPTSTGSRPSDKELASMVTATVVKVGECIKANNRRSTALTRCGPKCTLSNGMKHALDEETSLGEVGQRTPLGDQVTAAVVKYGECLKESEALDVKMRQCGCSEGGGS
jgi:hypothetical protein